MQKESIIVPYPISNALPPWEIIHISQDTTKLSISVEWKSYFDFGSKYSLCVFEKIQHA